jgi:uncharacterized membrane protein YphA (DoxX/SURF4 family)
METSAQPISPLIQRLIRWSIALVWLYQGFWNKYWVVRILAWDDRHLRIMQQALGDSLGSWALNGLAAFETLLAIAVLTSYQPRLTAWTQIGLLASMNTAGIVFAAKDIPDVGGMLTMNTVFGLAIWISGKFSQQNR